MHRHASDLTKGGALLAIASGLAEWALKHGLNDITGWCALVGALCAVGGFLVGLWVKLPEMHRTYKWLRGTNANPIEHED